MRGRVGLASNVPKKALIKGGLVKGTAFSRAGNGSKINTALAPEGDAQD
jgi:hypothetical protein